MRELQILRPPVICPVYCQWVNHTMQRVYRVYLKLLQKVERSCPSSHQNWFRVFQSQRRCRPGQPLLLNSRHTGIYWKVKQMQRYRKNGRSRKIERKQSIKQREGYTYTCFSNLSSELPSTEINPALNGACKSFCSNVKSLLTGQ